jgi:hypothetical protein
MDDITITRKLGEEILAYLGTRPTKETFVLYAKMVQALSPKPTLEKPELAGEGAVK